MTGEPSPIPRHIAEETLWSAQTLEAVAEIQEGYGDTVVELPLNTVLPKLNSTELDRTLEQEIG